MANSAAVDAAGVAKLTLVTQTTEKAPPFSLTLRAYNTGAVRMRILESNDLPPRWEVRAGRT